MDNYLFRNKLQDFDLVKVNFRKEKNLFEEDICSFLFSKNEYSFNEKIKDVEFFILEVIYNRFKKDDNVLSMSASFIPKKKTSKELNSMSLINYLGDNRENFFYDTRTIRLIEDNISKKEPYDFNLDLNNWIQFSMNGLSDYDYYCTAKIYDIYNRMPQLKSKKGDDIIDFLSNNHEKILELVKTQKLEKTEAELLFKLLKINLEI